MVVRDGPLTCGPLVARPPCGVPVPSGRGRLGAPILRDRGPIGRARHGKVDAGLEGNPRLPVGLPVAPTVAHANVQEHRRTTSLRKSACMTARTDDRASNTRSGSISLQFIRLDLKYCPACSALSVYVSTERFSGRERDMRHSSARRMAVDFLLRETHAQSQTFVPFP
jgi:hypothetical protein